MEFEGGRGGAAALCSSINSTSKAWNGSRRMDGAWHAGGLRCEASAMLHASARCPSPGRPTKHPHLSRLALSQLVEPGGLLMTCSCSGAMSQSGTFVPMLQVGMLCVGGAGVCFVQGSLVGTPRCLLCFDCSFPAAFPPLGCTCTFHQPESPALCNGPAAGCGTGCWATRHGAARGRGCARPHPRPRLPRRPLPH